MTVQVHQCPVPATSTACWNVEDLYQQYRDRISRYILRLVDDPELAEDLTQDTFVRVLKALPAMPEDLKFSAWLYRIATNIAYDALRRRRLVAWQPLEEEADLMGSSHDDPQATYNGPSELIRLALCRMSPAYRLALLLSIESGYSYAQIAQTLGIAPSGVKMYLSRARQQLKQHYLALEQEVAHI